MSVQFVDTFYFLALVNSRDKDHEKAIRHSRDFVGQLVTTEWVFVELADAMCATGSRARAARFIAGFSDQPFVEVVRATDSQFRRGLEYYRDRPRQRMVDDGLLIFFGNGGARDN